MRDIVIIGAGPAGLSAAAQFHKMGLGRSVTILEREAEGGGIPRHCGHATFGLREFGRVMSGPDYARRLVDRIGDCELRTSHTILNIQENGSFALISDEGEKNHRANCILLAPGMRETPRAQRYIAGGRPHGIMNTGRLQQHIYLYGDLPFANPVLIGSELVAFSAILTLRHAGIQPVAMVEQQRSIQCFSAMKWLAGFFLIPPIYTDARNLAVLGTDKVEGLAFECGGKLHKIICDGLILTGLFRPENALLIDGPLELSADGGPVIDEHWRCSDPHFYAAGNGLGKLRTAGQCWRQGRKAARAIARMLQ